MADRRQEPGADFWQRWKQWPEPVSVWGWDGAFWIILGLTCVSLLLGSHVATGARVTGATALVALGVAYATLVQRRRPLPLFGFAYLAVAIVAMGVVAAVDQDLAPSGTCSRTRPASSWSRRSWRRRGARRCWRRRSRHGSSRG